MTTSLIIAAVFIGVSTLVGGIAMMLRGNSSDAVADRLDALARNTATPTPGTGAEEQSTLLAGPLDDMPGVLESAFSKVMQVRSLLDQAAITISPTNFVVLILAMGGAGVAISLIARLAYYFAPVLGLLMALMPILWLLLKRKRRLAAFGRQLPEALDLIGRALRAGHSLGSGFQLVGDDMPDPIGTEFTRVFEEQNLGVPLDEALTSMADRVPNLDLRFFSTAVVLQKQTGGDLAEILDKIGNLIRERFKIFGQIQALTGEGRLSGICLLAMPPLCFLIVLFMNYDYAIILFRDPIGTKLIAYALVMQFIGALVIRKIVNIKV